MVNVEGGCFGSLRCCGERFGRAMGDRAVSGESLVEGSKKGERVEGRGDSRAEGRVEGVQLLTEYLGEKLIEMGWWTLMRICSSVGEFNCHRPQIIQTQGWILKGSQCPLMER